MGKEYILDHNVIHTLNTNVYTICIYIYKFNVCIIGDLIT